MVLFWDIETRSALDLEIAGACRYAADPSTEILCVAYAIDDGEPQIWLPGEPVPSKDFQAAELVVAHNYQFERNIAVHKLDPLYGWPHVPLSKQCCSMTLALASALPAKLESVAVALQLNYQKDHGSHRVMRSLSRPRKAKNGEDANQIYWDEDPEKHEQLRQRCKLDVLIERELFRRLLPLPDGERALFELDAVINQRGYCVDIALVNAAYRVAQEEQFAINAELAERTNGEITSGHQVARIIDFVRRYGHTLEALTKRSVSAVLTHEPEDVVRRVLELRREGARASTRKFNRLLTSVDSDGRIRGTLRMYGSSTGRWSGRGFQPQNLKKAETKDIEAAINAVLAGDMPRVRELGAPLTIAGDCSRAMVCAGPGHTLIGGDFSAIESRVLAWIAGEEWKLANYREYDVTGRPELEPYCATASRMLERTVTPDDESGRGLGKTADLGLGFGGSIGAWKRFNPTDERTDGEILRNIAAWRRAHPAIVRFWKVFERKCLRSIAAGQRIELDDRFAFAFEEGTLFVTLPSGRRLAYPKARLGPGKFEGTRQVYYHDNAKGGWTEVRAWYGTLVENAVQAIARDLLAAAMPRLEAGGYPIVLHVHDEIVCEVPEGFGSEQEFLRLLTESPPWAVGLPIAAKVWTGKRYAKTTAKPAAESGTPPLGACLLSRCIATKIA
jgi:DNA polymerase